MKPLILLSLACALPFVGCVSKSDSSDTKADPAKSKSASARPQNHYSIEDFMDTVWISGSSFSADESSILVSSDETGIFNAYAISIRTGERRPVTHSTNDSTFAVD